MKVAQWRYCTERTRECGPLLSQMQIEAPHCTADQAVRLQQALFYSRCNTLSTVFTYCNVRFNCESNAVYSAHYAHCSEH
eukprot:10470-Heterococcus_DN1.PRE.2